MILQEATKHRIRQTGHIDTKIRLTSDFITFGVVSRAADKTSVATILFVMFVSFASAVYLIRGVRVILSAIS